MNLYRIITFFSIFTLLTTYNSKAQELLRKNFYWNNATQYNPAFISYESTFSASFQSTIATDDLMPGYSMVNIGGKVTNNVKLGFNLSSEQQGPLNVNNIQGGYAFSFGNRISQFTLGMLVGVRVSNFETIDYKVNPYVDSSDPFLESSGFRRTRFTMGTGLLYQREKLEVAVSAPVLLINGGKLYTNLNAMVKYPLQLGAELTISPLGLLQYSSIGLDFFETSALVEWRDSFWVLAGFRTEQQLNTGVGFDGGNFSLGYTFVASFGDYQAVNPFINEILLEFKIPEKELRNNNFKNAVKSLKRKRK